MKAVVSGPLSFISHAALSRACLLLCAACLLASCSIPNLEETDCREARDRVREFYSFHFGNDMHLTEENVRLREKHLTRRLFRDLLNEAVALPVKTTEYFTATATNDLPKAFRVGECKVVQPGDAVQFDVLLFWKDDIRTEQRHVSASLKKEDDNWLIDSVSPLDK
ncbi:MAG: hypothetical protein ABI481_00080 [Pyrinomonadaceae bacterium]